MTIIILSGLLLSAALYLGLGFSIGRQNKTLGDLFPVVFGRNAKVISIDEFASSTTATSISLATIVLAYFELAGYFGAWLLWTSLTTVIGMSVVHLTSKRIWMKMSAYDHRPTMHEFIGSEFKSKSVALVASGCTSVGFLLIYATELVVGSRFLASLVPGIPSTITVVFLASIGFVYTVIGGFRVVVKTDQLQMKFIWAFIIAMFGYFLIYSLENGGVYFSLQKVPHEVFSFTNRPGLTSFLLGLAVMNIPGYLSNMSIWQRISGSSNQRIMELGMRRSIYTIALSWSSLALIACLSFIVVSPTSNQSLLTGLLVAVSDSFMGKIVLFVSVLGLYGAMLSTASTLLIVVGHTVSEDIVAKLRPQPFSDRIESRVEIRISQTIIVAATLLAIFLVEGLNALGFSIADLVFAIYGGALALFPLILSSLYVHKSKLVHLSNYANVAAILGFASGWSAAIYGKVMNDSNLIFLSPGVSLLTSTMVVGLGLVVHSITTAHKVN